MLKQNKIAKNFFLIPHIKLLAYFLLITGTCVSFNKISLKDNSNSVVFFNTIESILISALALSILSTFISDKKRANGVSEQIARKYLKEILVENPDLKIFENTLYNPIAIKNITNYLTNTLTKSEYSEILNILHKMDGPINYTKIKPLKKFDVWEYQDAQQRQFKFDMLNHVKKCHEQIIQIIRDHASVHPEFINEIRYALCTNAKYINTQQTFVR